MVLTFPLQEMAFLNDNKTHGSASAMKQVSTLLICRLIHCYTAHIGLGNFQGAKRLKGEAENSVPSNTEVKALRQPGYIYRYSCRLKVGRAWKGGFDSRFPRSIQTALGST
jgi:hypothetical protein